MFPAKIWSKKEDSLLREYYPSMGKKIISLLPGRTKKAVKGRVQRLELKFVGSPAVAAPTADPVVSAQAKKAWGVVPPERAERIDELEKIIASSSRIDPNSIYVHECRARLRALGAS